jgi:MFS family permease
MRIQVARLQASACTTTLAPGETGYLLWSLLGYLVITAVLLVTCVRISDIFGRVRLYNLGFAVFTVGSIMLFFIQGSSDGAAMQLISPRQHLFPEPDLRAVHGWRPGRLLGVRGGGGGGGDRLLPARWAYCP